MIDNDASLLELLPFVFTSRGVMVLTARDGPTGIGPARKHRPTVIQIL